MRACWIALIALLTAAPLAAQVTIPLPATEAAGLIGKTGLFAGTVAGIRVGPRGTVILDLDRRFPKASLSVVVPGAIASQITELTKWTGRRVSIHGLVQRVDGRLQITVEQAADLAIAEQPDRIPCD